MRQEGYSSVEVIIATIILSLLILIAVPNYIANVKRSAFAVVIEAAQTMQEPVTACAEFLGTVENCGGDTTSAGKVSALSIKNGIITAVGNSFSGNYSYILTPDYDVRTNMMVWNVSGTCLDAGACSK